MTVRERSEGFFIFDYIVDIESHAMGTSAIGYVYLGSSLVYRVFMDTTNNDWVSVGNEMPTETDFIRYLRARFAGALWNTLKED